MLPKQIFIAIHKFLAFARMHYQLEINVFV